MSNFPWRSIGLSGLLALLPMGSAVAQSTEFIYPNDAGFSYTEYVRIGLNAGRARFHRWSIDDFGVDMSPGARVNFSCDALVVRLGIDVRNNGFASGLPRLYIDGELSSMPVGDGTTGIHWVTVLQQTSSEAHKFSLVMPYDVTVDFLGAELDGGSGALLDPPQRPASRYVAYGDSITHGFNVSDITSTYPHGVAQERDLSVINMGFGGLKLEARDGYAIGNLGPDLVSALVGTNDYNCSTSLFQFRQTLEQWLSNLREEVPLTPIYMVTPMWIFQETWPNNQGLVMEDYRTVIRQFVDAYADTDPNLLLLEGPEVVPADFLFFPDGIHPNDAGHALIVDALAFPNLVRGGNFDLDPDPWVFTGAAGLAPDPQGGNQLTIGAASGRAEQRIYGLQPFACYRFEATSLVTEPNGIGTYGVVFYDDQGALLSIAKLDVDWLVEQTMGFTFMVPSAARRAEVLLSKSEGPGHLVLDDLSIRTEVHAQRQ